MKPSALAVLFWLVALPGTSFGQAVFPASSDRQLYDEDLAYLSCGQLWVARNEIYHRNGYCFKTKRGRNFFSNQGCWTSNAKLTRLENRNVASIQRWEKRRGCR